MRRYVSALIATAALATPALGDAPETPPAAEATLCHVVVDPAGDTTVPSPAADVRSADVGTDSTYVGAIVRVAHLGTPDAATQTGGLWFFGFSVGAAAYRLEVRRDPVGPWSARLIRNGAQVGGPVPFYLDFPRGEIRWLVQRTLFTELPSTLGTVRLTNLHAGTAATPADIAMDTASSATEYVDGEPSCALELPTEH